MCILVICTSLTTLLIFDPLNPDTRLVKQDSLPIARVHGNFSIQGSRISASGPNFTAKQR